MTSSKEGRSSFTGGERHCSNRRSNKLQPRKSGHHRNIRGNRSGHNTRRSFHTCPPGSTRRKTNNYIRPSNSRHRSSIGRLAERTFDLGTIPIRYRIVVRAPSRSGQCLASPMSREPRGHSAQAGAATIFSAYRQPWQSEPLCTAYKDPPLSLLQNGRS